MVSYAQMQAEACYLAEVVPPGLVALKARLRLAFPGVELGDRGNNLHVYGYHRSRRWVKESAFCTNRTYSVSRTPGDVSGGDANWVCALDITLPSTVLHEVCRRLDAAVRAGLLEKITEWYGSFGDDDRVDGFDNISNRLATSDPSHLWHLHLSFDRGRVNENHDDVVAVLVGSAVIGGFSSMFAKFGDGLNGTPVSDDAMFLQDHMLFLRPDAATSDHPLTADGKYGNNTSWWVSIILTGGAGGEVNGLWFARLDRMVAGKLLADSGNRVQLPSEVTINGPFVGRVTGYL